MIPPYKATNDDKKKAELLNDRKEVNDKCEGCKRANGFNGDYIYTCNCNVKLPQIKGSEENKENYISGKTPSYYTGKYKGIKAIDVIHDFELSHCKASALEYILRSGKKDNEIQDLTKAVNHLEMQIKFLTLHNDI